jgi:hypothetical protein
LAVQPSSTIDILIAALADPVDVALLKDPAAWRTIREHAGRHGVAQLIAFNARTHVPAPERAWCDRVLTRSWTRYLKSLADLQQILELLQAGGIRTLTLKGPLLAHRCYQPPFLRKSSVDIDLAIRNSDLGKASELFLQRGYTPDSELRDARARSHHLGLTHPSMPRVELHIRLSHGNYGTPVDEFFGRALPCKLPGGFEAWVMSPADELFHLVLHRAYGRFATLFHLYEIRRLWSAATPEIRRETVRRAVDHHFAGAFAMTAVAFEERWGEGFVTEGDLPETWLHGRIGRKLYADFEKLSDPGRELPLLARLERRWIDFQLTDRPADARRFLAIMLRVAWHQVKHQGWKTVKVG